MDESTLTEMSLLADNRDALCEELCKFAVEIKTDKTQYPPRSIQLLLCGLQRYIRQERPQPSPETDPLTGIDINELFGFEL